MTNRERLTGYHGSLHWKNILKEGLKADRASGGCPHIWLALRPDDAKVFGRVLQVDMTNLAFNWMDKDEPAYQPYWQGCYHGGDIEAWRIKLYD